MYVVKKNFHFLQKSTSLLDICMCHTLIHLGPSWVGCVTSVDCVWLSNDKYNNVGSIFPEISCLQFQFQTISLLLISFCAWPPSTNCKFLPLPRARCVLCRAVLFHLSCSPAYVLQSGSLTQGRKNGRTVQQSVFAFLTEQCFCVTSSDRDMT